MSEEHPITVRVTSEKSVTAIASPAESPSAGWTFIYAPGAGSNVDDPFGRYASVKLSERGIECVRFHFPYQEVGRKSPDPASVLEETWTAVIERFSPSGGRLAVGGRSMGGRIASQAVAKGAPADAVVLFAYPLHPPGKPENRRDQHLPSLTVPVLFCSGTNDAFASPEELREIATPMSEASVHLLEGADHGFNVRKASGRTREDVWAEATDTLLGWLHVL